MPRLRGEHACDVSSFASISTIVANHLPSSLLPEPLPVEHTTKVSYCEGVRLSALAQSDLRPLLQPA